MHYSLLRHHAFDWDARSELYALLDNVIPTDYLDEKSFASNAAAKARAGVEIELPIPTYARATGAYDRGF